jgi:carbon monoxide dehydrogenase subunit G
VYIREEPGRYVGRGSVPAGELIFEILIEKAGETYRWLFRGVQRGLIIMLGRQFFESLAGRLVERIVRCL